jgi:hypothetical protein
MCRQSHERSRFRSYGDQYVNQIIEQGLKKNSRLRLVVVSPNADKLTTEHRFLDRNPRVSTIRAAAKTALNDRLLVDRLRDVLKDVSTEEPFPQNSEDLHAASGSSNPSSQK